MNCPKCGKTLINGEICPCQQLDIFQRQMELEKEQAEEQEAREIEYNNQIKQKNKKINNFSDKGNNILNVITDFLKEMFFNFKNIKNIKENYIEKENKSYAISLYIINLILTSFMIYLLFSKTLLSMIFLYFSLFSYASSAILFFGSFIITVSSVVLFHFGTSYCIKKNPLYEISASYIYTIPATLIVIILSLISSFAGIIILPTILIFKAIWTNKILVENGNEIDKSIIFISIGSIIISSLMLIILKLIS